jgi:hypothetical protein
VQEHGSGEETILDFIPHAKDGESLSIEGEMKWMLLFG